MLKKLFKILEIIKTTKVVWLIIHAILILIFLSLLKLGENLNTSPKMKFIINSYKTKLKNKLKILANNFTLRLLETIFSTSIILTFISYILDIPKIIEKINFFVDQKIDEFLEKKNKRQRYKEVI